MANKRQYNRFRLISEVWLNNAASTVDRSTDWDDYRNDHHMSNADGALLWVKARADIVA